MKAWLFVAVGLGAIAALLFAQVAISGFQSTQDESKELEREGADLIDEKGLDVKQSSRQVDVGVTAVVSDRNGAAAVVELRNKSPRALAGVPVEIDVKGKGGKSVFKNDAPGLEPSLTSIAVLGPHEQVFWVNDQVLATATPESVKAQVGGAKDVPAARVAKLEVGKPKLERDPASGVAAIGYVTNRSRQPQKKVTLYAVAHKGSKLVAAGRAGIRVVKARKRARYTVLFIGDPRGATIEVAAPPTVLE